MYLDEIQGISYPAAGRLQGPTSVWLGGVSMKRAFVYCRVSTDDEYGVIRAYLGEGNLTDDTLETFGGYGVVHIPNFQKLLRYICENGYEHHVAMNLSQCADAVAEAFDKYLGWEVYHHE